MAEKKTTKKPSAAKKNIALFKFELNGRIWSKGEEVDLPEEVLIDLIGRGFVGKAK